VNVNWDKTEFVGTDGTSPPMVSVLAPPSPSAGVYVSFHLGPPVLNSYAFDPGASVPFINGALHLVWTGPVGALPRVATPLAEQGEARLAGIPSEAGDAEEKLRAAINQLPPDKRAQVMKARVIPPNRAVAVHRLTLTRSIRTLTEPPPVLRVAKARHAIKAGPATRKMAKDAAQIKALCAATNNTPSGLPAQVCTPNVRDHR
jgi:hypothetical protein